MQSAIIREAAPPNRLKELIEAAAEVLLSLLVVGSLNPTLHRDMKYAVNRTCQMAGCASRGLLLDVPILRETLRKIRPAAHGVSHKTWANIRSLFGRVLELAGVIDRMRMGLALRHPMWGPLMKAVANDKRLILTPADG